MIINSKNKIRTFTLINLKKNQLLQMNDLSINACLQLLFIFKFQNFQIKNNLSFSETTSVLVSASLN